MRASLIPIHAVPVIDEPRDGPDRAFDRVREALAWLVQVLPEIRAQDASLVFRDMGPRGRISYVRHHSLHHSVLTILGSRKLVIPSIAVVDCETVKQEFAHPFGLLGAVVFTSL